MSIDPLAKNDIIARWKNKQSIRGIARELQLGRAAIATVISQHLAQTQSTDSDSPPACFGPARLTRKSKLDPFLDSLKPLLARYPNITAQRAFEELHKLGYSGSYSTLRTYIKDRRLKPKAPVVRFETPPGAQAQMDWSTYTIDFTQEGRRRVELFSYILGYSRRQYICFTDRQDFETTVRQHVFAFEHLGGAAATCLYDNMKVVVTRWEDGQPIYNPRFLSFATHYGFKPWACEPRRPETKGKIERPFDYAEKNLLNGRTFRSLEQLNEVARWWLREVNDVRNHGTTKRTPFELHEEEKPYLIDLPGIRFDTAQVVYRKVDSEGFIQYADNRYSAPWRLTAERLAEQRRMLPNVAYARLWLNEWSSGGGDALTKEDIAAAFRDELEPMVGTEKDWLFVGGVDLGLTRDCSAVIVLAVPKGGNAGRIRLAHNKLWRPILGKKVDLLEVESHLLELDRRYKLEFVAFDPWQMEHLAQRLEADTLHRRRNQQRRFASTPWMREIPPTGSNLREMASLTIEFFQDRRLLLYHCEPLRRDLLKLRVEEKSYGPRLLSPRDEHGHGDTFSAFALALLVAHEMAGKRKATAGVAFSEGTSEQSIAWIAAHSQHLASEQADLDLLAQADSSRESVESIMAQLRLNRR